MTPPKKNKKPSENDEFDFGIRTLTPHQERRTKREERKTKTEEIKTKHKQKRNKEGVRGVRGVRTARSRRLEPQVEKEGGRKEGGTEKKQNLPTG